MASKLKTMTPEQVDEQIWSCITRATKHANPIDSDGYDEVEVYSSARAAFERAAEMWENKAGQWDRLVKMIEACYVNEDGTENTDPDIDLCTIGEIAATATGFL